MTEFKVGDKVQVLFDKPGFFKKGDIGKILFVTKDYYIVSINKKTWPGISNGVKLIKENEND